MEERADLKCKFTIWDSCSIQNVFERQPTELECIACSLRQVAIELHAENGVYRHAVQLIEEEDSLKNNSLKIPQKYQRLFKEPIVIVGKKEEVESAKSHHPVDYGGNSIS